MNREFGRYGFTFEKTGIGDAMIVRSFDGKHTLDVDLDPFKKSTEIEEASNLRKFLTSYAQEDFKIKDEDFLSQAYKAQNLRKVGRLNPDGTESTVKMTSFEQDGKFYAMPTLFPKDPNNYNTSPSTWDELSFDKALKVARERGELFQFKTDQEAKDFAKGSWKDVSTRDVEADKFYKSRGLDYISEKKRYDKYKELDDIIDFVEGNNEEGREGLKKTNPELFINGRLREDAEEYIKEIKNQRDALEPVVKDYGFFDDAKSEVARMDWDAKLAEREKEIVGQAIKINNEAKAIEYELDAKSIETFGIPAKDLLKYKNTDPNMQAEFDVITKEYYSVQQTQKEAATKFEVAKTYFDAKADKQINGELKENLRGFWNSTYDAYSQGLIGEQLLSFTMPGGKDVSSFADRKEAAEYIAKQYADMYNTESRAMARWRNTRGFQEGLGVIADDPAEFLSTWVATSVSQILPYGWKIIAGSTATGAGVGAAIGAPVGGVGAIPGLITGAGYGFRSGMAITNLAAEYTGAIMSAVESNGYNPMDPESLAEALGKKEIWDEGKNIGLTRGIPIAVVDMLSAGLAGRIFKPASALASRTKKIALGAAERLVIDPVAEGTGELFAQGAEIITGTGRKSIGWKEIAEETMGGLGNNTINWGMNTYKDLRDKNNIDIANSFTNIANISSESASDEKITTWVDNMLQLKKIDADVAQRINENVGLRREARELLEVGTNKNKNSEAVNRTMELLAARKELSSSQNRREIYRSKIQDINAELAIIGETKNTLPVDKAIDLSTIIGTTRQGTSQYSIDGRRFTKEQFIEKVKALPDEQLNRVVLGVKNDPETGKIIKQRYNAIQKQAAGQVPVQSETGVSQEVVEGEPQAEPQVLTKEGVQEEVDVDVESKINKMLSIDESDYDLVDEDGRPDTFEEDRLSKDQNVEITNKGATVFVKKEDNNEMYLYGLASENKNKGEASELLDKIISVADKMGYAIKLEAMAESGGLSQEELISFYKNKGFEFDGITGTRKAKAGQQGTTDVGQAGTAPTAPVRTEGSVANPALKDVKSTKRALDEMFNSRPAYALYKLVKNKFARAALKGVTFDLANANENRITAEAYHQAKKNGKNPELVKAVEELFGKQQAQESEQQTTESVLDKPIEEVSVEDIIAELNRIKNPLSSADISVAELNSDGEILDFIRRAYAVLKFLYPKATFEVYNTTKEYEAAGGRRNSRGEAMMNENGEHRILLNLEVIKEQGSAKTAFHEVIHPIVYDAFGASPEKLIPIWNELFRTMRNVKGMERVFSHVSRYPTNEIAVEGITETITQIAAGNIDLSSVPKSQANKFIELINKLFEALKIDFRINSINDFSEVSKKVKQAFETSNAESLKGIIKGGKNIDNYYKNLKNRDANPEAIEKLQKLLQEKLKIEVESGRLKQDNANKILKDNNIAAEESLTTKNKENEKVQSERTGDGAGRDIGRKITPLEGTPSVSGFNGPDEQLVAVAEKYAAENGIDLKRQSEYVEVDEERATRIADAYEQMANDPQNPKVKEAYQELIKQTMAQYQALVDAGYKFWFMDLNIPSNAEYAESPYNAMRDLRQNKTMGVFPTVDGFGTSDLDVSNNPLLEDTGLRWSVGGVDGERTIPVLANDLFRAVHDAFGHGLEGSGFRARGEENAWQAHVRLFTGPAVGAITSETRGQNSWVNFGPNGESNRTASTEDTVFADQKTGLMPDWTWTEGRAGDMKTEQEAKPTTEQIGVKELMTADTKTPTTLNKVLDLLNKAEESIDKFGKETAGVNIALPLAKVIIKAIKALVKTGITLQEAIRIVAEKNKVTEQDIIESIEILTQELNETNLPGYDRMMGEVNGIISKSQKRGVPFNTIMNNAMEYVKKSKVYENATDIQRESLVREIRKLFGKREKAAPSVSKVLGETKTKVTVDEMAALKSQIKLEARAAREAKLDLNGKRRMLSDAVRKMASTGKIPAKKVAAIINKIGKLNLDSYKSVQAFIDYAGKVFADAEYADKLSTAKSTKSEISSLSRNKEKNANLRDLAREFIKIDPSLVEDIDAYNEMASLIKESLKGSKIVGKKVNFAEIANIEKATEYIKETMNAQREALQKIASDEIQELMGVDPDDFTYEELLSLLQKDEPITKYNESIIRNLISKMFDINSSIIKSMIRTGVDAFTGDPVDFTKSQVDIITRFMDMNLDRLSAKEALQTVDALANFIQNKSTAKMESVLADYQGKVNAEAILKKGIFAVPLRKMFSKDFGRLLAEQTTNLGPLFTRLFKGVQRGGLVEEYMGVTKLTNSKALAETEANNIANDYVKQFYNKKANGEIFNTELNNIERGMASFMLRNVIGTDTEMQEEFDRRKRLIAESIDVLREGTEIEQKKAELYSKVFDKIVSESTNIQDIKDKTDVVNLDAVNFWVEQWSNKYDEMADVSLNVYNRVLGKDINYNPDKFVRLTRESGDVELSNNESAFHNNNGTIYKKESSGLMTAVKPKTLPKNTKNGEVSRYIDLSFDKNNANSMYDALVDIKTAASIRQIESFLNSSSFNKIIGTPEDAKILKERIQLYVSNIRNKNPYSSTDELSKTIRRLNKIAAIGVGQALGGVTQPLKQVIPVAINTLINAGSLDLGAVFNSSKNNFISNSGYAIANRGVESQALIDSINRIIEEAANSNGAKALRLIEEANQKWLKVFLVKPDVFIARASWLSYYEQSLKKQGIDTKGIDYDSHVVNEQAGNYAQRMVDRQQNISDADQAGKLFADKNDIKQVFIKMLMPFASFRMNQATRLSNDLSTIGYWNVSTTEDKIIAARSLAGFAAEMATFKVISGYISILLGTLTKMIMGREEEEEEYEKRKKNIIKGQLTGTVTDIFSPIPLLDKPIQGLTYYSLDKIQDMLNTPEDSKFNIYNVKQEEFIRSLGLFGIAADRANQLAEIVYLSQTGQFKDNYGNDKYISQKDQSFMAKLIGPSVLSNFGLAPSEVSSVIRMAINDAKKKSSSKVGGKSEEDLLLDKKDKEATAENKIKKEEKTQKKIKALEQIKKELINSDESITNEIQRQIDELSMSPEQKKAYDEDEKNREAKRLKEEEYDALLQGYENQTEMKNADKDLWEKTFGPESPYSKENYAERMIKRMLEKKMYPKKKGWD
jgi:hypothetical protein